MKKIMLGIAALMGMVGIATATEITWEGLCKNVLHPLRDNSGDPAAVAKVSDYVGTLEAKTDGQREMLVRAKVAVFAEQNPEASAEDVFGYAKQCFAEAGFTAPVTGRMYPPAVMVYWRGTAWKAEMYKVLKGIPGVEKSGDMGGFAQSAGQYEEACEIYIGTRATWAYAGVLRMAAEKLGAEKAFGYAKRIMAQGVTMRAADAKAMMDVVYAKLLTAEGVKPAEMKEFLQTANRKFTVCMPSDPTAWEPVVAGIRNALDAF